MSDGRTLRPVHLLVVGAAALAVRLAHAWFVAQTPFFEGPVIDAWTYRRMAEQIASTGEYGGAFYQPPLYPAFLAVLVRMDLGSPWAVAIAQSLLGASVAAMLAVAGARLASSDGLASERNVGLAAGLAAALYGPLVLFDLEVLPPALVHALLAGALLCALRARARPDVLDGLGGLLVGAAVTGWGPSLVFGLALPLHRLRHAASRGARALIAAIWIACMVPPVALTAWHNARHDGEGVLVSFNDGINLFLGNNPGWRDTWRARPGAAFEPELERPDREGVTRPADRSRYFVGRVWRDVAERPGAAAARTGEKLYYAWHGREVRRNQDIDYLRERSPVLHALTWEAGLLFPFGLLAPLALSGFVRRRRDADTRIALGAVVAYSVVLAVFFVSSRYRLPMALWLLPFAADEGLALAGERPRALLRWIPFAAALVVLNLPNAFTASFAADPVERAVLEAHAWRNQGEPDRAASLAEALAADHPDDPNVQMLLAEVHFAAGRCDRAVPAFERVVELAPRASTPRVMLGQCLEELGDPPGAERAYAGALALHPYHPVALKSAAALYLRFGRSREARVLLRRFVAQGYDDPEVTRWLR